MPKIADSSDALCTCQVPQVSTKTPPIGWKPLPWLPGAAYSKLPYRLKIPHFKTRSIAGINLNKKEIFLWNSFV